MQTSSFLCFTGIFFFFTTITLVVGGDAKKLVCNPRERQALLTFKQSLVDPYNHLSSWTGEHCCSWFGIQCHTYNTTPRIVAIDLHYNPYDPGSGKPRLSSKINPLDPHPMDSLYNKLHAKNLQGVSTLSHLQYLDLHGVDLSLASDHWLHAINMLPSLLELRLSYCQLTTIPSLSNVNFTSLQVLDLSRNNFNSTIPEWLFNLTSLKYLDLSATGFEGTISAAIGSLTSLEHLDLGLNRLTGTIPTAIGDLTSLEKLDLRGNSLTGMISAAIVNLTLLKQLDLGWNSLTGSIPMSIRSLSLLRELDLSNNKLNGTLPRSVGQLSKLENLILEVNSLEGVVSETHFANLTMLKTLQAGSNSVVLKVSSGWNPPFQVELLHLSGWILGPKFPAWLQTQEKLSDLDFSSCGISSTIPTWFWNMTSHISSFNLSHNQLKGKLPSKLSLLEDNSTPDQAIDLNSNQFEGPLPRISSNVIMLDLSNNSIFGPISSLLCKPSNKTNSLRYLVLSHNLLSEEIPKCLMYWKSLELLKLDNNILTGSIPSSIGALVELLSLHLENNRFYGELPSSMQSSKFLCTLDLGDNKFSGNIPAWVGTNLSDLMVLRLHSNEFDGNIPEELCYLTSLQVLDISHNNLSGKIPPCFGNFSGMIFNQNSTGTRTYDSVTETSLLIIKGIELEVGNNLRLETIMDLSANNLSGGIPDELTSLLRLRTLNLSNNHLMGKIPEELGDMSCLESLDFSNNQLSGVIPPSMSSLNFLAFLNLSCNNLSGEIPSGTQLQGFNPSSYANNSGICGPPMKEKCKRNEAPQSPNVEERIGDKSGDDIDYFHISMAVGFVLGSWSLWGVLIFNKSWRFAYCRFIVILISEKT